MVWKCYDSNMVKTILSTLKNNLFCSYDAFFSLLILTLFGIYNDFFPHDSKLIDIYLMINYSQDFF